MPDNVLKAALEYAKLGWLVVPTDQVTRAPLVKSYKNLKDPAESLEYFKSNRVFDSLAKIIDPDEIVVDIDNDEWVKKDWPVTPTVKTPRGLHLHFKRPTSLKMGKRSLNCGDGFEVKAGGMLSSIPPGKHRSGVEYTWKYGPETQLSELPQWCIDKIHDYLEKTQDSKGRMKEEELTRIANGVNGGERNDAMMRYGGHLIGKGVEWSEIENTLNEWNKKNKPTITQKEFKNALKSLKGYYEKDHEKATSRVKKNQSHPKYSSDDTFPSCPFGNGKGFTADVCGELVCKQKPLFVLRETLEFYIYKDGVYRNIGTRKTALPIRQLIRTIYEENGPKDGDNESISVEYINAVLSYLQDTKYVETTTIQHQSTGLICLDNGVYDRKQKTLLPHSPTYRFITKIPVKYDPEARCPAIEKFISEVVNPECVSAIYEFFGYCLIPDTRIQKVLLFIGTGANGKSVLIRLLDMFIGSENVSKETLHKLETDPYSPAELFGKLVNTCAELPSKGIYENSTIKQLTGDEGAVRARKIYCPPFTFKNNARLLFGVNNAPPVPDDPALFRRFTLINFPNKFEGNKADKNLFSKLATENELSGLLNITLRALDLLLERGEYSYSPSTEDTRTEYRIKSDPIAAYTQECLVYSEEDTSKTVIYANFCDWCNSKHIKLKPENEFAKRMRKLGYEPSRPRTEDGSREHVWQNVAIKPPTRSGVQNLNPDQKNQEAEPSWSGGQGSKSHCCLGNLSGPSGQVEGEKEESMYQEYNNREIALTALTRLEPSIESSHDQALTTSPDQNSEKPEVFEEKAGYRYQFRPEKYPIIVVPFGQGNEVVQQQLLLLEA